MERYSPEYMEDEPLDLSLKPRGVDKVSDKKPVQQESPLCLVKSCDCNSHKKRSNKGLESSSYPASSYDNRFYSGPKYQVGEHKESWRKSYDSQSNGLYLNSRQSNSAYLNPNQSNGPYQNSNHSVQDFSTKNQSTMGFPMNGEMPERYDESARRRSFQGTSLMDFVNDSIEIGLQTEKADAGTEPSRRIKREYNETLTESLRHSPSGSKRQKININCDELKSRTPETNEQTSSEENIDVFAMNTSNSPEPDKKSAPSPGKSDGDSSLNLAPEKENGFSISESISKPSYKIPALDYLISKVLVERLDIPFIPKNHAIKRIFTGEGKGQLRLMDLIELQVEESLKC